MESNLLKLYRNNKHITDHHKTEDIRIALLKVDGLELQKSL